MNGRSDLRRAAVVAGVALAALSACGRGASVDTAPAAAEPTVLGRDSFARVRRDYVEAGPRVAGSLEPERQAAIRAEVGGAVEGVRAEVGQPVRPGQLLARIDARALEDAAVSARSAVRSAELDVKLAERQRERTRRLVDAGALAERELEVADSAVIAARAKLDDARARMSSAKKQLDSATVTSPMPGVVSGRSVNEGDVVAPGAELFTVIDPSSMRLDANVPSEDLANLKVGTAVEFEVRGYPGQTFTGRIERIAPAADPTTRQIPILVAIPNPGGKLVAGLFAEGRVVAQRRQALVVPASALDESGETATVLRVRNGKAERVAVKLGLRDERQDVVEILSGLNPGDVVLTGASRSIPPGTPLKVPSAEPAPA